MTPHVQKLWSAWLLHHWPSHLPSYYIGKRLDFLICFKDLNLELELFDANQCNLDSSPDKYLSQKLWIKKLSGFNTYFVLTSFLTSSSCCEMWIDLLLLYLLDIKKRIKLNLQRKNFHHSQTQKIKREKSLEHMFLYSKNMVNIDVFYWNIIKRHKPFLLKNECHNK